jgi:hypothetical protein
MTILRHVFLKLPLHPESSENIPILLHKADLCFSKQNDPRNPKMGSKQLFLAPRINKRSNVWCFKNEK